MRIFKTTQAVTLAALMLGCIGSAAAGVQVGGTRIIFDAGKKDASISVENKGDEAYAIQSWIDNGSTDGAKTPFLVTPPLMRLDGGKTQALKVRLIKSGDAAKALPKDRESLYWFNVKEIPPKAKGKDNTLQIAVRTRIKLLYRPANLTGSAAEAASQLKWAVVAGPNGKGAALEVENPTPYYVNFSMINVLGAQAESINADAVAPMSKLSYPLKSAAAIAPVKFNFMVINDFGALSNPVEASAEPQVAIAK
ncbi:molecular chaperone [Collimonas sp.]|jgi:P pilus assembly chaperone PapD|uniref:fimbrial biogenesis chaperone n=1 Tax=Collimonas sp. TaxID=1963772 RepID=UPI002BDA3C11|nr:molecular chaperone [Collimonas sp.]HWW07797.1 molecular chaperone [Collimonas sp.]